jgi:hypothetical protein
LQLFRWMAHEAAYSAGCHSARQQWRLVAERVVQCDAAADGTLVAVQRVQRGAATGLSDAALFWRGLSCDGLLILVWPAPVLCSGLSGLSRRCRRHSRGAQGLRVGGVLLPLTSGLSILSERYVILFHVPYVA